MLNPYVLLGGILALILAASGGAYVGKNYAEGKHAKQELLIAQVREQAQLGAAEAIGKISVNHTTIRQKLEKELHENTVYVNCDNSPVVERLLDDARANREPADSGGVPGAGDGQPQVP